MYHIPYANGATMPNYTVPSYPVNYLASTLVPSTIYEPQVLRNPIFNNDIPVFGIKPHQNHCSTQCDCCCSCLPHKSYLDQQIEDRVRKQLKQYQQSTEEHEACNKCCFQYCTHCEQHKETEKRKEKHHSSDHEEEDQGHLHDRLEKDLVLCCAKCHHKVKKELTLDEKIQKIRKELNLPSEKENDKLIARLEDEKRKKDKHKKLESPYEREYYDCKECKKHEMEIAKTKYSVNVIKERKSRSRSKSAGRSKSANGHSKSRSPSAGPRPLWYPVGLNDYSRTNEKRNDMLNDVHGSYHSSDSEPKNSLKFFNYQKSQTPTLESLYYSVKSDCGNLYPISSTQSGKIFTCQKQNELHYVTDKALRNGGSNGQVKISNSDKIVIHD